MDKLRILRQFMVFLSERKKYLLMPILLLFFVAAVLLVSVQGSIFSPFLYPFL